MPIRRFLALLALAVCLALPAAAQKRRSVRFTPPAAPPTGGCHTFGLVQAGLQASYLTTTPSGNVTFTITWISDTPTRTHTTQKVTTPQGTADAETILDGEIVGTLRALKHFWVKTTTTVAVIGKLTTEVDVDYVPSLAAGPAGGWCVGATWNVPPSTQTISTRPSIGPPTTITNNTIASQGEVLAVGAVVTVPAGIFNTVKYRGVTVSGTGAQVAITWVSMDYNIVVKQDTIDAAGNVTSVTTLTDM
ncbi:MAG: hypothetical protein ACLGH0_04065 [Thermoanaerobaculia bacterium]